MAKEINWNTVLIVLVIGVVGVLLLSNSGITGAQIYKKTIKETVRCSFSGSNNVEKCFGNSANSLDPYFTCVGVGSCDVTVSGSYGEKITWKSSCGGYVTTVIDGKDEKALFLCTIEEPQEIKATSCDGDGTCEVNGIRVGSWKKGATGYVCVDEEGNLYKSLEACKIQILPSPSKCADSDVTKNIPDGKNYYTLGKTCAGGFCKPDRCIDDKNLMEYYCQTPEERGDTTYNCKGGCKNGVCLWLQ